MNAKKSILVVVFTVALAGFWSARCEVCKAEFDAPSARYIVEVEYYQWQGGHFFWAPVLETDDKANAQLYYEVLVWAKHNGLLHVLAAHEFYGYFPVDVRIRGHHLDQAFVPVSPFGSLRESRLPN